MNALSVFFLLLFSMNLHSEPLKGLGKQASLNDFEGTAWLPSMKELALDEAPEEYIVERGDTLFDICDQLLGEPQYWPKLWALNPSIKNPNFVYPGMRIRFYSGDEDMPPKLEIVQEDDIIPVVAPEIDIKLDELFKNTYDPKVILDAQLPEFIKVEDVDLVGDEISVAGFLYTADSLLVQLPGFMVFGEAQKVAEVLGGFYGESFVSEGSSLVIHNIKGTLSDEAYTVLRPQKDSDDDDDTEHYLFVAHISIEESLEKASDDYRIAKVGQGRLPIQKDDIVVPYAETKRYVKTDYSVEDVVTVATPARILGFGNEDHNMGGQGSFVFLSGNIEQGFDEGSVLEVFPDLSTRSEDTPYASTVIGYLKIIDTTKAGSVGYVLSSKREILVGDYVGRQGNSS